MMKSAACSQPRKLQWSKMTMVNVNHTAVFYWSTSTILQFSLVDIDHCTFLLVDIDRENCTVADVDGTFHDQICNKKYYNFNSEKMNFLLFFKILTF